MVVVVCVVEKKETRFWEERNGAGMVECLTVWFDGMESVGRGQRRGSDGDPGALELMTGGVPRRERGTGASFDKGWTTGVGWDSMGVRFQSGDVKTGAFGLSLDVPEPRVLVEISGFGL